MPFAVAHVLVPIILVDLIRDHVFKKPKLLPNRYVFLAGVAGLITDAALPIVVALNNFFKMGIPSHRLMLHNIWLPLSFLAFFAIFQYIVKDRKFALVFLMLFTGTSIHLILDAVLTGDVMPLYPLNTETVNWNLIGYISSISGISMTTILVSMDAMLLLFWLWHEEYEHHISDYF